MRLGEALVRRVGIAALRGRLAARLLGFVLLQGAVGGERRTSKCLREAHDNAPQISISGHPAGIGYILLAAPLFFLFKAAQAAQPRVRNQLIGLASSGRCCWASRRSSRRHPAGRKHLPGRQRLASRPRKQRNGEGMHRRTQGKRRKGFAEDFESAPAPAEAASDEERGTKASNAIKDSASSPSAVRPRRAARLRRRDGLHGPLGDADRPAHPLLGIPRHGGGRRRLSASRQLALLWFVYLGLLLIGPSSPAANPRPGRQAKRSPGRRPGDKAAADLDPRRGRLELRRARIPARDRAALPKGQRSSRASARTRQPRPRAAVPPRRERQAEPQLR